jgi:hypothetical protein
VPEIILLFGLTGFQGPDISEKRQCFRNQYGVEKPAEIQTISIG